MLDCDIQMVLIAVPICNVYNNIWTFLICQVAAYKKHSHAMPFVINNNISAFFILKIENFPIQLAIFDILITFCITFYINYTYPLYVILYIIYRHHI